jgi:hypothetical protein
MTNLLKFAPLGNAGMQPTPPNGTKDLPTLHTGSKNKLCSALARLVRFLFVQKNQLLSVYRTVIH